MTAPLSLLDAAKVVRWACTDRLEGGDTCADCERLAAICEAGHRLHQAARITKLPEPGMAEAAMYAYTQRLDAAVAELESVCQGEQP